MPSHQNIREARLEDAEHLAPILRRPDLEEIQALSCDPPAKVLRECIEKSDHCYALINDEGEVRGLFGDGRDDAIRGRIWMLGSDEIAAKYRFRFLRESKAIVEEIQNHYQVLWNYVYAYNTLHIRWLQWLGVSFISPIHYIGIHGEPFYKFVRMKQ